MALRLAALVAVTMIAFAANSVLVRLALTDTATGPASFGALRLASGAAVLAALTLAGPDGQRRLADGLRWRNAAALAVYVLGFSFAYLWLDAGVGALILFGCVQVTMFAGALAGGEAIRRRRWIGAALAFGGLAWLVWPTGAGAPSVAGATLMAAAGIAWGVYSLLGRGAADPVAITAGSFCLALLPALAVLALWRDPLSGQGALLAILSGAVTSGLGYALWYRVLPLLAASAAAVAQLSVPVLAMAGGALLLGEPVGLRFVVAAVLVTLGVLVALPGRSVTPPAR